MPSVREIDKCCFAILAFKRMKLRRVSNRSKSESSEVGKRMVVYIELLN
jgi:hypothetical protein